MKFIELRPMLWTTDLPGTIDFYTKTLGFTCDEYNSDWGWASMHRDLVEIMFAKPNAHTQFEKPIFTGSIYCSLDDVDELWEELKDSPSIYYKIENFEFGMREFAIKDNNGYVIQFGTPVEN